MYIPDDHVQAAFDILRDPAHAKARAAHEYAEKRLKVVLAKAQLQANGKTVGEREASALASEEYEAATKAARLIAESYYALKDQRDAASATLDAWRTQQSDLRSMGKVA